MSEILLGYEIGSGGAVKIPMRHLAVTGQTQQSGKTTALEALVSRSGASALAFVTKRGEASFADGRRITPYFRDRADWQFVTSIIDATLQEKNKFLRPWIMKICRNTRTLADVQREVRVALTTAKGLNEGVYTQLDAYLDLIVPEIGRARLTDRLDLRSGINVMDVSGFSTPMQMLFIQSALDWVNEECRDTVVVVPEAWEFVPEGKGSPVKASAIALVRKGAGIGNYIWIDSQDMAGVDKTILRGCTVWLIGAQREANEIKRNLLNIPAGISRPKPSEIALLERGQFFACFGKTVAKIYVRPSWMGQGEAVSIAVGKSNIPNTAPRRLPKENDVTEAEARELRDENSRLKDRISQLERSATQKPSATMAVSAGQDNRPIAGIPDMDSIYSEVKRRAAADAGLLRVLASQPEIEVSIERRTVELDGTSLKGRIARLIAQGFMDQGVTQSATRSELKRTGPDVNAGNLSTTFAALLKDGFITLEGGNNYRAVKGMKVNIVKRGD